MIMLERKNTMVIYHEDLGWIIYSEQRLRSWAKVVHGIQMQDFVRWDLLCTYIMMTYSFVVNRYTFDQSGEKE